MNPWPFVLAAYALTLVGAAALALWSWSAMRSAESQAARLTQRSGSDREA